MEISRRNNEPVVVSVSRGSPTSICHCLRHAIGEVGVVGGTLFRRCACLQSAIAVISKGSKLSGLIDLRNLIANIVCVIRGGIDRLIPIQFLDLAQAPEDVLLKATPTSALIPDGGLLATGTAATSINIFPRTATGICCQQRPSLPIVGLQGGRQPCGIVAGGHPASVYLSRTCLLRNTSHDVVKDKPAGIAT